MPYRPKNTKKSRRQPRRGWPWIDWITDESNPRVIHRPGDVIHGARSDYRVTPRGNFVRIIAGAVAQPFAAAVAAKEAA